MPEFRNTDEDIDAAEDSDARAEKRMQDDGSESGNIVEKISTLPEFRSRDDHEEQYDLEAEEDRDNGDQSSHL